MHDNVVREISGCPRQLKLCSGNHFSGKIKVRLPEKNSQDNPGKTEVLTLL